MDFESQLQQALLGATELCFQLKMKPDPVLQFEIEAWVVGVLRPILLERTASVPLRLSFSSVSKDKKAWSDAVSLFSEISWKPLPDSAADRAEFWLKPLGLLEISPSLSFFETFINEMVGASVDSSEPPWVFWSRFPAWWSRWDRRQSARPKSLTEVEGEKEAMIFELDSRLTFLRCALSPQDETTEKQSLEPGEIMLNPTFETVQRPVVSSPSEFPLLTYSRSTNVIVRRRISSLEALLIDGVRESFRISESNIIGQVHTESQIEVEFIRKAITQLTQDEILLRR